MKTGFWGMAALCAALAGCGAIPDYRAPLRTGAPVTGGPGPVSTLPPLDAGPMASAGGAEAACLSAGRDAGFDVQGVVGTREVTGAQGVASARDVMLRVRRGGQTVEVRCSYAYDTGSARIMTL